MNKACHRCKEILPVDSFYRRADAADGRQYSCKSCTAKLLNAWKNKNPEKAKAANRARVLREKEKGYPRSSAWRSKNRERVNATAMKSYWKNRNHRLIVMKKWRTENPEKMKALKKAYRKNNRPVVLAWLMRRRARKAQAPGYSTAEQIQARVDYYGGKCYLCRIAPYEHIDHVIPIAKGGTNWPANLRPACAICNMKKHDKLLSEVK